MSRPTSAYHSASFRPKVIGSAWTPFDLHLDYLMTIAQLLSAGLLLWIVVRMTRFLEARYVGSAAA